MALIDHLDLSLALRRVKLDIKAERVFFEHPFELQLIQMDEQGWLDDLTGSISAGTYRAGPLRICEVPKAKGHVRPGGYLALADQVYYTALVGACLEAIITATAGGEHSVDFSYRLNRKTTAPEWLLNPFVGWSRFREASLERIRRSASYVVFADVAGYYETISIRRLLSDLRQYGVPDIVVRAINDCLNHWARVRDRGIPQGFSASDLLGKLYLTGIDRQFSELGFSCYRYVDDFRIFCRTRAEARSAIAALTGLLRERGLVFQSSKTAICPADEASTKIDGIAPLIGRVRRDYMREIARTSGLVSGYMSLSAADDTFSKSPNDAPVEVIERAYASCCLDKTDFDKSLFRFLLKRLGFAKSRFALDHCAQILVERPEETAVVVRYWSALAIAGECDDLLARFLQSDDAVYPYQVHQLLSWRTAIVAPVSEELLRVARRHCFEEVAPPFLQTVCRRFLAQFGSLGDISRMQDQYDAASTAVEKSEIMCCVARLEPASRNEFLRAASSHSDLTRRADQAVRRGIVEARTAKTTARAP